MAGQSQRIFGTPPEPVFNMTGCCLSTSLLEELFVTQATYNEKEIGRVSPNFGVFRHGRLVECIFIICEQLRQPAQTRYLASELFDRFMRAHILKLKQASRDTSEQKVRNLKSMSRLNREEWKRTMKKLCKQMLPFMVSCVQIASKLCSHYRIVTCRRCSEMLQEKGHHYSTNRVLVSELLVMKTLDYNLHVPSPLNYVETLLEIMGHNSPSTQVKVIHEHCLPVLDVVYIKRRLVYDRLLQLAIGDTLVSKHTRSKFAAVENDLMLLAAAAIGAAASFIDMKGAHKVNRHLARITRIPLDDITDFSSTIVSVIVE